jgi:hypothetical protein
MDAPGIYDNMSSLRALRGNPSYQAATVDRRATLAMTRAWIAALRSR